MQSRVFEIGSVGLAETQLISFYALHLIFLFLSLAFHFSLTMYYFGLPTAEFLLLTSFFLRLTSGFALLANEKYDRRSENLRVRSRK